MLAKPIKALFTTRVLAMPRNQSGAANSPRIVVANILSKLAIYFLSFGLILLLLGGVRALLFPANATTKVLVVLGIVTASLGIIYTVSVVALLKCLQSSVVISDQSREEVNSISRNVPLGRDGASFVYTNPGLFAVGDEEPKTWEAPPCYDEAIRSGASSSNTLDQVSVDTAALENASRGISNPSFHP